MMLTLRSEVSELANSSKCLKIKHSSYDGRVAQLGEHLLCKQGVAGSNPVTSTNPSVVARYWHDYP